MTEPIDQTEHKIVWRPLIRGQGYGDPNAFIAPFGAEGWSIQAVNVIEAVYTQDRVEVFYLQRPVKKPLEEQPA